MLEPAARLNPIEIAVDVELQQYRRMIRRPAGRLRIDPLEPKLAEVKLVDKDVDDSNRIVLMNPVFQAFRKQRALPSIRPLNKPLHTILPQLRESYDANHSGAAFSHSQGHHRTFCSVQWMSALPPKADVVRYGRDVRSVHNRTFGSAKITPTVPPTHSMYGCRPELI